MPTLKIWQQHSSWENAESHWETGAYDAAKVQPLKGMKNLPIMQGITPETARHLKWKSFKWMLTQDHDGAVRRGVLKHPLKYGWAFLRSLWKKKSYRREGDFFLYGISDIKAFEKLLEDQNNIFVLGFSYCHKPFECPSGRFTAECHHDANNPVCRQCFIGKCFHALPEGNNIPLVIPTVHYIGGKIFDIVHNNPGKKVVFLITACEMTLEMFGDWGNMAGIQGIGIRLGGRICNTMKAFELSERGIKPGMTVVMEETQQTMLRFLRIRHEQQLTAVN